MLSLGLPWAGLLAIPAVWAWWRWLAAGHGRWWRLAALLLLVLAATGPRLTAGKGGSDVVVILDRSASVGEARAGHLETLRLIGDQRRAGDRLAVVTVAEEALVAQVPRASGLPDPAQLVIPADGSRLAAGLRLAQSLVAPGRSGRVLVVSDGEDTGFGLRAAAAGLTAIAVPVDVLPLAREGAADAAVIEVELPAGLRQGESFQGAFRVLSDVAETRSWRLLRGDQLIASGAVALQPLAPQTVLFADRPPQARLTSYTVELDATGDRQPANNRAGAALRVTGGEQVLVVGGDGQPGNLARALAATGMRVSTRPEGPVGLAELTGVTVLVLEQVPADRLGHASMEAIAQWTEHLGGGLVLTGGRRAFGAGGYHRSPIERVSPVTMEIRDEQRKLSVAMAITLDRSGSMAAPAGPGRTKMDLANEGTLAAIELLGQHDQVAVHAVDSTAHPIVTLTRLGTQRGPLLAAVRGIRSQGGGIYVYQALLAAGAELAEASAGTKHLVLFADAADAEEPGDYRSLLARYRQAGITVSVVAMGLPTDSDAAFLEDVAKRGGGRISYASEPADIPRLFAQETVLVSRTAWVDQRLVPERKPGLDLVIPGFRSEFPALTGYNLTYLRPRAQLLAWCVGDPAAPAVASWRIGSGRTVAVPLDTDASLSAWPSYAQFLGGLVRWAAGAGGESPAAMTVQRSGATALLRLELDPRQAADATVEPLVTLVDADGRPARQVAWQRIDQVAWEAEVPLTDRAVVPAATVVVGDEPRSIAGPALRLAMSPEVAPRFGLRPGRDVLAEVARETGGTVRADVAGMFRNPPSPGSGTELAWLAVLVALLALVGEVAVRRWQLGRPGMPQWRVGKRAPSAGTGTGKAIPSVTQSKPPHSESRPSHPPGTALGDAPGALGDALAELKRRRRH